MFRALERFNVPEQTIKVLKALYDDPTFVVRIKQEQSEPRDMNGTERKLNEQKENNVNEEREQTKRGKPRMRGYSLPGFKFDTDQLVIILVSSSIIPKQRIL